MSPNRPLGRQLPGIDDVDVAARGARPRELVVHLVSAVLSPQLQRVLAQLAQRTLPAA